MSIRRIAVVGAVALLGVGVLAGCSSSSGSSESSTASAAASGGTQVLPPVIVTEDMTSATAKVGDFIDIVVKEAAGTTIDTDKPELLEISQAHNDGSAEFNPGAKALAPGNATITVTNPDSSSRVIAITITE